MRVSLWSYLEYPRGTIRQFCLHPLRAFKNTWIVLAAFWHTIVVGLPVVAVLFFRRRQWSEEKRGRYIWDVAQYEWARWILRRAGVALTIDGFKEVDWREPCIVVANHQSVIDALAIIATIPEGRFVAKREALAFPVVGLAVRYGGQIVVDRGDHTQSMRAVREGIAKWPHAHLVFFAEGTRTTDGSLGKFKMGAFAAAHESNLPIVPLAIHGTFAALRKGSLLGLEPNQRVRLMFGSPIAPRGCSVPELAEMTRSQIAAMLDAASKT